MPQIVLPQAFLSLFLLLQILVCFVIKYVLQERNIITCSTNNTSSSDKSSQCKFCKTIDIVHSPLSCPTVLNIATIFQFFTIVQVTANCIHFLKVLVDLYCPLHLSFSMMHMGDSSESCSKFWNVPSVSCFQCMDWGSNLTGAIKFS